MRQVKKVGRSLGGGRQVKRVGRARNEEPFHDRVTREISEAASQLTQAMQAQTQAFRDEINNDFYTVLTFQNGAQLEAFVRALGIDPEKTDPTFLDGERIAKLLGVQLPPGPVWKETKVKHHFAALARKPG